MDHEKSTGATGGEGLRFASPAGRWVVAATVLGSGMVLLDSTVVNVALPRIGEDLHAGISGLQWIVTGYLLTLSALILLGGSLGDRYGRRRVFCIGLAWFAVSSALCAFAPTIGFLVVARALQGIGGALLTPGSLAIISASFHPDDSGKAIGAWSGLGGVAAAVGPFLGGWLVLASWRWIFLINLPIAVVVLWVAIRHVPESRDPDAAPHLDITGAAVGAAGLAAATYGLTTFSPIAGLAGAALLAGFLLVESRSRHPMMPLSLFASRVFAATNALTFLVYGALGLLFFLIQLVLQISLGYSPLASGAATIPITALMLAFSAYSGQLAQRTGPRLPLTAGPLIIAIGLVLFTRVDSGSGYLSTVLPATLVFGAGLALMVAPLTATVLAAAGPRHAGVASGVNNAVARVAGLVAVAGLPLLAGFDPRSTPDPAELLHGFHTAMLVSAGLAVAGALIAVVTLPGAPRRAPQPVAGPTPQAAEITTVAVQPRREAVPCFSCGTDAPPAVVRAEGLDTGTTQTR